MASALKFPLSESKEGGVLSIIADKLRAPHLNIAEITEMIHVSIVLWLSFRKDTLAIFLLFLKLLPVTGRKPSA